jgi:ligand-binding sensor domain-containing protein
VIQYDGETFRVYTTEDGLAGNSVYPIAQDQENNLWFGTGGWFGRGNGVSRYGASADSERLVWKTFDVDDGLAGNWVRSILVDRDGNVWFGTNQNGVTRHDGKAFTSYSANDMLPHNRVHAILQDRDGDIWFGTYGGLARYDGKSWQAFTTEDGLAHNYVISVLQDRQGFLWFGTYGGGISRYDGRTFRTFTTKDGLSQNTLGFAHK